MLFRYQNPVLIFIINTTLKRKEDKAELFLSVQKVIKLYRYFLKSSVIVMLTDENVFMHHFSKKNYGIPGAPTLILPTFLNTWCHDVPHKASTVTAPNIQMRRCAYGQAPTPKQHARLCLGGECSSPFWSGPIHSHRPQTAKVPGKCGK